MRISQSVFKVLFLAIGNISKKWTMPIQKWKAAKNRFTIECEGRIENKYSEGHLHRILEILNTQPKMHIFYFLRLTLYILKE